MSTPEEPIIQTGEIAMAPVTSEAVEPAVQPAPVAEPAVVPAKPVTVAMPTTDEVDLDQSEPEAEAPAAAPRAPNFKQEFPYSSEGFEGFDPVNETAFLPADTVETVKAQLTNLPNTRLGQNKSSQDWFGITQSGLTVVPFGDGLAGTASRENADYRQTVTSNIGPLGGFVPKFKKKSGEKPMGESARFHIRATMNMGTVFSVPLWHSGFWITIKAPAERDLLELYRMLTADKISLGRSTYGFIYSNGTSYTTRTMMDFIVEHLYETSIAIPEGTDIRDLIRMPDLQTLIWGLACACWPGGFQYQRSCVNDPEKCNHVVTERLNLSKLLWTDTSALTEWQTTHMTKRLRGSSTVEEAKRYVDEFVRGQERLVDINESLKMVLRVPTVNDHVNAGYRWVNSIEEMYARVLINDEQERDDYLIKQGKATAMRQYSHFVKAIKAEDYEYDETETIEFALDDLTSNDRIRELFIERAKEFMENSIITLVAIPTFTCPKCGHDHKSAAHPKHHELIALDVMQSFFQLLVQRLQKIESR